MKFLAHVTLGFLAGLAGCHAAALDLTIWTKDEIMANMTLEKATSLLLSSHEVKLRPDVMVFLESTFGGDQVQGHLRTVQKHGDPAASLEPARKMLNEMMDDSNAKLDNEAQRCSVYNRETVALLEQIRQDGASFTAGAAESRSRVLKSQGVIAFTNLKLPQVEEELTGHNQECVTQETSIKSEIQVVVADLAVMAGVFSAVGNCEPAPAAMLIQCRLCKLPGEGSYYTMIQNKTLQPLLLKLRSAVARLYLQKNLGHVYEEAVKKLGEVALTQEQAMLQVGIMQDPLDEGLGNINISDTPKAAAPKDCVPTNKCTLGKGSCTKIRDGFMTIAAGIQDTLRQLQVDLAVLQEGCLKDKLTMEAQIANMGEKMRNGQTDLATATKDQVSAESSAALSAQQHDAITGEFGATMKECCNNQNALKSEICALEKIRGELYKQKGISMFITDCSVSEWRMAECSVSCGGGVLTKSRSIVVHPNKGMACPPQVLKESCNTHPCPIDCVVGEWEGWSSCSAECGGGVRERMRPVVTEMKYGGEPCEDTEASESCNAQSCAVDCVLEEWTEWSGCSQECGTGYSKRDRAVRTPAAGTGTCADPVGESRLESQDCNPRECTEFLHESKGKKFLQCGSKIDMIILMDGSGSMGSDGWKHSKNLAMNLLASLPGGDDKVKVALEVFSGPATWDAYERCNGKAGTAAPDIEKDCQVSWIKHLTNNTVEVAALVKDLKYPESTTMTSAALGEAGIELINGRPDAASVVIVITDGTPMSKSRAATAAKTIMEKARLMWVPVGSGAPMDWIETVCSWPKEDNVIHVPEIAHLSAPFFANTIISKACPILVPPPNYAAQEAKEQLKKAQAAGAPKML